MVPRLYTSLIIKEGGSEVSEEFCSNSDFSEFCSIFDFSEFCNISDFNAELPIWKDSAFLTPNNFVILQSNSKCFFIKPSSTLKWHSEQLFWDKAFWYFPHLWFESKRWSSWQNGQLRSLFPEFWSSIFEFCSLFSEFCSLLSGFCSLFSGFLSLFLDFSSLISEFCLLLSAFFSFYKHSQHLWTVEFLLYLNNE